MARSIYEYMNQMLPGQQQPQINIYGQQAAQMPYLNLSGMNRNLNSREGSAYSTEEERVLLDKATEDQLRERVASTDEYKQWLDAQAKLSSLQNQYADYLESRKEKDKDLRNAAIIGRTMAAVTGDKSWGDIVQEPLTEEQKIATRLGFLKNEAGDLKERMGFISEERKNQLLGKSSVKYGAKDLNLNEGVGKIDGKNFNGRSGTGGTDLKTAIQQNEEISDRIAKAGITEAQNSLSTLSKLIPNAFDEKDSTPIPGLNYKIGWGNLMPDDWSTAGESPDAKKLASEFEALIIPLRKGEFGATLNGNEKASFEIASGKVKGAILAGDAAATRSALVRFREIIIKKLAELERGRALGAAYEKQLSGTGKTRMERAAEDLYGGSFVNKPAAGSTTPGSSTSKKPLSKREALSE